MDAEARKEAAEAAVLAAVNDDSRSNAILIVTSVFFAISLVSVCLRIFVRTRVVRAFGWDDITMVVAMVCLPSPPLFCSIILDMTARSHIIKLRSQSNLYWYRPSTWVSQSAVLLDRRTEWAGNSPTLKPTPINSVAQC